MKSQSPLTPNIQSVSKQKTQTKDLTDTLLANNLNQLNLSASKTNQPIVGSSNYMNLNSATTFPSSAFPQQQFATNRLTQPSMSWNQTATQNFGKSTPMQLVSQNNWTSAAMMLPSASSSQSQSTQKLSTEEIMDFLK